MNQSSLYNCFHSFQWLEIEVRRLLVLYKGCYRTCQWFIGKWRLTEGIWEKGWDHSVASHTSRCVQKRESTSESWYVACYCVTADTEWPCSWSLEAVPTALWSIVIFWAAHWSISLEEMCLFCIQYTRAATNDYFNNRLIWRLFFRLIDESDKNKKTRKAFISNPLFKNRSKIFRKCTNMLLLKHPWAVIIIIK